MKEFIYKDFSFKTLNESEVTLINCNNKNLVDIKLDSFVFDENSKKYNVVKLEEDTFYDMSSLKTIYIPDSVTDIGIECFESCINLTEVRLSSNITNIYYNSFCDCPSLKVMKIDSLELTSKEYKSKLEAILKKTKTNTMAEEDFTKLIVKEGEPKEIEIDRSIVLSNLWNDSFVIKVYNGIKYVVDESKGYKRICILEASNIDELSELPSTIEDIPVEVLNIKVIKYILNKRIDAFLKTRIRDNRKYIIPKNIKEIRQPVEYYDFSVEDNVVFHDGIEVLEGFVFDKIHIFPNTIKSIEHCTGKCFTTNNDALNKHSWKTNFIKAITSEGVVYTIHKINNSYCAFAIDYVEDTNKIVIPNSVEGYPIIGIDLFIRNGKCLSEFVFDNKYIYTMLYLNDIGALPNTFFTSTEHQHLINSTYPLFDIDDFETNLVTIGGSIKKLINLDSFIEHFKSRLFIIQEGVEEITIDNELKQRSIDEEWEADILGYVYEEYQRVLLPKSLKKVDSFGFGLDNTHFAVIYASKNTIFEENARKEGSKVIRYTSSKDILDCFYEASYKYLQCDLKEYFEYNWIISPHYHDDEKEEEYYINECFYNIDVSKEKIDAKCKGSYGDYNVSIFYEENGDVDYKCDCMYFNKNLYNKKACKHIYYLYKLYLKKCFVSISVRGQNEYWNKIQESDS